MDEKGKEQEMCVPAESSGTSPTFKLCCLYKKKKGGRQQPWIKLVVMSSFALRVHKNITDNSLTTFSKK